MPFFGSRSKVRTEPARGGGGAATGPVKGEAWSDEAPPDAVEAGVEEIERASKRQEIEDRKSAREARLKILKMTLWAFVLLLILYAAVLVAIAFGLDSPRGLETESGAEIAQRRLWQLITYVTPIFASYWGFYYATSTHQK